MFRLLQFAAYRPGLAIRRRGNFPPGPVLFLANLGRIWCPKAILGLLQSPVGLWDSVETFVIKT